MSNLVEKLAGKFIVLDGPDGSGKTTQLSMLHKYLEELGGRVELLRDPGGTPIGEKIREVLLDKENIQICPMCETLLFMASRAQLIEQRIKPALQKGMIVLCDRFISATIAYQGAAGIDPETIIRLGEIAIGNTWPDLTIILDVPVEIGIQRKYPAYLKTDKEGNTTTTNKISPDRLESKTLSYHQKVRQIFLDLSNKEPNRYVIINADAPIQKVHKQIRKALIERFSSQDQENA